MNTGQSAIDGATPAARADAQANRASRARDFYRGYPAHPSASEARNVEIFSLIQAVENGDTAALVRLNESAGELRSQANVPAGVRARGISAYEFTKAVRGLRDDDRRKEAIEKTARDLIREFPSEPQGYEALLAVAAANAPAETERVAREVANSVAPEALKKSAQTLADRYGLVGSPLAEVLGPGAAELVAQMPARAPVIVYSWATWGPGSIELGRMIQARRFVAIAVCLDENRAAAELVANQAGLGGKHAYDSKRVAGELATRLKFSTAGQIYLVDAGGIIRDVRGGENLETKLKQYGFKTPSIIPPSMTELLRQ